MTLREGTLVKFVLHALGWDPETERYFVLGQEDIGLITQTFAIGTSSGAEARVLIGERIAYVSHSVMRTIA